MLVPQVQALSLVVLEIHHLDLGSASKDFRSFIENKTSAQRQLSPVRLGEMRVDQTLLCQEGGGLKPQHCSIANHILTAYLCFKDLLSQMPHRVLNYKLDHLTSPSLVHTSVSLVTFHYKRWPVCSVYWENTWSLERAVCPSSFEREQGLVLLETYFTFPKTSL